jgi:hypothetical protein
VAADRTVSRGGPYGGGERHHHAQQPSHVHSLTSVDPAASPAQSWIDGAAMLSVVDDAAATTWRPRAGAD